MYYGLKVCNKQSLCHFGTQTNKQFNSLNGVDYSKPDSEAARVKYALMAEFRSEYMLCLMCRVMSLSRSGYYKWIARDNIPVSQRREAVKQAVIHYSF